MPGEQGGDMSVSLGIKAASSATMPLPPTPGGKQKHNSFISSHVSNLWDRASSRRRAMSSGAKSNPPAILEVRPSIDGKYPDPRDTSWTGANRMPPPPPVPPAPEQADREGKRERRTSLKSLRKASFSSTRSSNIPRAAVTASNMPALVSILRKPGSSNVGPPFPQGPPPILSPASSSAHSHSQSQSLRRPPQSQSSLQNMAPSGLPQPTGIPQPSYASGSSHGASSSLSQLPQPSGLPRTRRARPSGIYGIPGQPAPDLAPSASSHSHSFSHTRGGGGSISQTSDGSHSALQPKSQARNDEASSRELGRRTSLSSHHSRNMSSSTMPSALVGDDALSRNSSRSIPAPTTSLKTFPAVPTASNGERERRSRFSTDMLKSIDTSLPPTQDQARYSAKPLPPAPAGATAISRLPSLRTKVPIVVSATPVTHVKDHIRSNTVTTMPAVADVELTTPLQTVRGTPNATPAVPNAMDLFAVSQKLENISPEQTGYPEHYLRGSEIAANNSLGLEEPPGDDTTLAYMDGGTDMSRSSTAPLQVVPLAERGELPGERNRKGTFGWNTPASGGAATPTEDNPGYVSQVAAPQEPSHESVPVKADDAPVTRPRKDTFGSLDYVAFNGTLKPRSSSPHSPPRNLAQLNVSAPPVEYQSLVTPATPVSANFDTTPVPPVQYRPVVSPDPDSARPKSGNWFTTGSADTQNLADNNTVDLSSSPDLDAESRPQSGGWFAGPTPPTRLPAVADLERLEKTPKQKANTSPTRSGFGFPSASASASARAADSPTSALSPISLFKRLRASPKRQFFDDDGNTSGSTEMVAQPSSEGHTPIGVTEPSEPVPVRTWSLQGESSSPAAPVPTQTWPLQRSSPSLRSGSPELAELTDTEDEPRSQLRSAVTPVDWPIMSSVPSGPSVVSSVAASVVDETPVTSTVGSPSSVAERRLQSLDGRPDSIGEVITFGSQSRTVAPRPFTTGTTGRIPTPDSDEDIFMSPPMAPYLSDTAPGTPSEYMTPNESDNETAEPASAMSASFTGDESAFTDDAVTADEMSSSDESLERALAALSGDMPGYMRGRSTPTKASKVLENDDPASPTTPRMKRSPLTEFPFPSSDASARSSYSSIATTAPLRLPTPSKIEAPNTAESATPSPRRMPLSETPVTSSPNRPQPPKVDIDLARTDDGSPEVSPTDPLVVTPGVNDFPSGSRSRSVSPKKRADTADLSAEFTTPPPIPALDVSPDSPTDPLGITPRKVWSPLGGLLAPSPEQEPAVADVSFTLPLSTSTTAEDLADEAAAPTAPETAASDSKEQVKQDTLDALEELENLMKEQKQTEADIREQLTPVPTESQLEVKNEVSSPSAPIAPREELDNGRTCSPNISTAVDISHETDEISSINSSPPVRIADLNSHLDDQHFATAPITTSLEAQMYAAEADPNLFAPHSRAALFHHRKAASEPTREPGLPSGSSIPPEPPIQEHSPRRSPYMPYGYPYGSQQMGKSAVSLSIDEPPLSANTDSSRSSATFGLEYLRHSMDSSFDADSPYGYERSLPNASKDSILLSSSPDSRRLSSSPARSSLPLTSSPLQPSQGGFASPEWPHAPLGLGSPINEELTIPMIASPTTQSLALAGAPVSESDVLLRPSATSSPIGTLRTPSPAETETQTISAARPFAGSPVGDISTPVGSSPSLSTWETDIPSKRNSIISPASMVLPASRALMAITGSAPASPGEDEDTDKVPASLPPSPQKRTATPIRTLVSPEAVPSPTTTETGTAETGTTETIRASMSPVAAATLPKPVTRASSTNKPRPPPLRPTFFAPPPLNSDGTLLVVGSQHFNETLEQVSSSLGTTFKLSPDGLHIQAPAQDLYLIMDHIKMMRSILGDMHRPSTRTLHESRSPVPPAPPPPPPPPPLSPGILGSPALSPKLPASPSLGPDSPPSANAALSSDSVPAAAAAAARKRSMSPNRTSISTAPKSPVLQSLAEAAAAKALKHGAFTTVPPRSPTSPTSPNSEDPWRAAREKMRHVGTSPINFPSPLPNLSGSSISGPSSLPRVDGLAGAKDTPQARRRRQVEEMRRREREEGIMFRKANKHEKVPPLPIASRVLRPPRVSTGSRNDTPIDGSPRSPNSSAATSAIPSALPSPILLSAPAEVRPQMDAVYERLKQSGMGKNPRNPLVRERTRGSRHSPSSSISSRIDMSNTTMSSSMSPVSQSPASAVGAAARMNRLERRGSNSSSSTSRSSFRVQRKPIPREASDSSRDTRDTRDTSLTSNTLNTSFSSYNTKETSMSREPERDRDANSVPGTPSDLKTTAKEQPTPKERSIRPLGPPNSYRAIGTEHSTPAGTPTGLVFPVPKVPHILSPTISSESAAHFASTVPRPAPTPPSAPTRLPHISAIVPNSPTMPMPSPVQTLPRSNLAMSVSANDTNMDGYGVPRELPDDMGKMTNMSPPEPLSLGPKSLARIKPPKSYRFKFGRSGGSID